MACWIGFHVVGWGGVAALVWTGATLAAGDGETTAIIARCACWLAAAALACAIRPRPVRFAAPGLRVREHEQPRLFAALRELAERVDQPFPDEVYLTGDVNAFVGERREGARRIRIMGIGLPLLRILDADEVRAVLAHEFGHFAAGDTRLGPWVHRTRCGLTQATRSLGRSPLGWPLRALAHTFHRLTRDASRLQELAADRLAAYWVGRPAKERALRTVYSTAAGYAAFLREELLPVLEEGWRPPLVEGFARFLHHNRETVERALELAMRAGADPDDTHPPLRERLAAIADVDAVPSEAPSSAGQALDWIDRVDDLEGPLVAAMFGDATLADRPPTSWGEAACGAYTARWIRHLAEHGHAVPEADLAEVPELCARAAQHAADDASGRASDRLGGWSWTMATAAATALTDAGFAVSTEPGAPLLLVRDGRAADPFAWVEDVVTGRRSAAEVRAEIESIGPDVGALPLAGPSSNRRDGPEPPPVGLAAYPKAVDPGPPVSAPARARRSPPAPRSRC